MTKKLPDPIDPKATVTEVFKRLGGIAAMTQWGRTHKSLFYSHYTKLISQPTVVVDVTNTVNAKADDAQLQKAMVEALARTIASARRIRNGEEEAAVATITDVSTGEVIVHGAQRFIEHDPVEVRRVNEPEPPPPERSTPRLVNPDDTSASPNGSKASPNGSPVVSPEEARRRAMEPLVQPPVSTEQTTTQKYLDWAGNGGGRMTNKDWGPV